MIAIFASGTGSNFAQLAEAFPRHVRALVCNVEGAGVLGVAARHGIPARLVPHAGHASREEHERAMLGALAELVPHARELKVLVLAGYMRVLGRGFLEAFEATFPRASVVNLHPAHLDEYRGARAYERAVSGLFPRWGLSVHRVTEVLDGGELLASAEIAVFPWETPSDVHARARPAEHALLARAVTALLAN